MTKKLRFRFVIISIISVFLVVASIIGTINVTNFRNVDINADNLLRVLVNNGGKFDDLHPQNNGIGAETPFETRYFSVKFDGENATADTTNIAAVSDEQAISFAKEIIEKNNTSGYVGVYRYKVSNNKNLVVFVDCTRQIETANKFLTSSIFASSLGLFAVFVVALLLSKIAISPIVESYEKQKEFITNASHELKTPLTIISANNEIIEMTAGESESTQIIAKQVAKMTAMVKNLTSLSRLQEFDKIANKSKFCISDMLKISAEQFLQVMKSENKILTTQIQNNIEYVGDKNLINQLLSILLENATKYSLTKTNVLLKKTDKCILIKVSNDANGIENGNLNKSFERFYRAQDKRASSIEGSGIGLSVAKEIVNLHNGKINAFGKDGIYEIVVEL